MTPVKAVRVGVGLIKDFAYFSFSVHYTLQIVVSQSNRPNEKAQMMSLGFRPGATGDGGLKVQMN